MRTLHRTNHEYTPKCFCNIAGVDDALIGAGAAAIGATVNGVSASKLNKKNREWQEKMMNKQMEYNERMWNQQNDWNVQMWDKTNAYNAPSAQLARLRDAGLNPLYYGLDGTSANGMEAAQALSMEQAKLPNQVNPVGEGLNTFAQMKGLDNSTKLVNAQIDKLKEEQSGLKLDNEFKEKSMAARVEAENLANSVSKKQMEEADSRIEVNKNNAKKIAEEAKTEEERRAAIMAEKLLTDAKTKEILEMLPYKKLLTEAETLAQKARAAADFSQAAINKGLLDGGYVQATIDAAVAAAEKDRSIKLNQDEQAKLAEWKNSIRNGTYFDLSECTSPLQAIIQGTCNSLMATFSQASEIALGGIRL